MLCLTTVLSPKQEKYDLLILSTTSTSLVFGFDGFSTAALCMEKTTFSTCYIAFEKVLFDIIIKDDYNHDDLTLCTFVHIPMTACLFLWTSRTCLFLLLSVQRLKSLFHAQRS